MTLFPPALHLEIVDQDLQRDLVALVVQPRPCLLWRPLKCHLSFEKALLDQPSACLQASSRNSKLFRMIKLFLPGSFFSGS